MSWANAEQTTAHSHLQVLLPHLFNASKALNKISFGHRYWFVQSAIPLTMLIPAIISQGALLYLLYLGNCSSYLNRRSWVCAPRSQAWLKVKQNVSWVMKQFRDQDQGMSAGNRNPNYSPASMHMSLSGYGYWHHVTFPPCKMMQFLTKNAHLSCNGDTAGSLAAFKHILFYRICILISESLQASIITQRWPAIDP